ncbi:hypothetical protein TNCT_322841 [Trichonephila clavata]|uniref:Uncharacterized protein n=1 Tax=Trichonephila clavata TaxID=2740835 RepID=A0A8X6IWH4_TRICU|nr:hypothetical protein TNCT_322841 [Trichonephila clavata]
MLSRNGTNNFDFQSSDEDIRTNSSLSQYPLEDFETQTNLTNKKNPPRLPIYQHSCLGEGIGGWINLRFDSNFVSQEARDPKPRLIISFGLQSGLFIKDLIIF